MKCYSGGGGQWWGPYNIANCNGDCMNTVRNTVEISRLLNETLPDSTFKIMSGGATIKKNYNRVRRFKCNTKKRNTKKRNVKKRNTKKRNANKRNTKKRNAKKRNAKKRNSRKY